MNLQVLVRVCVFCFMTHSVWSDPLHERLRHASNKMEGILKLAWTDSSESELSRKLDTVIDILGIKAAKVGMCTKDVRNVTLPKSCAELRLGGATCDGAYVIYPEGLGAVRAVCDMTTDGGGWTVLMRRGDYGEQNANFYQNWENYKNGFGYSEGEFWIGNEVMHAMTTQEENKLRVHLTTSEEVYMDFIYNTFAIANESYRYRLSIGSIDPDAYYTRRTNPDSLIEQNGYPFGTYDQENDEEIRRKHCAFKNKGGWWFTTKSTIGACFSVLLTGKKGKRGDHGIAWNLDFMKRVEMMIRPGNFSSVI